MEINNRFKRIIFKKLANDLSHVEIIPYEDSIWFIDRNDKYWYLELENRGHLWWRLDFFVRFFQAFSLEEPEYEPIIKEWVEQVLKRKVNTTTFQQGNGDWEVEQVLKRKVNTTRGSQWRHVKQVEQVLKRKVNTDR
jgi:hypothetical protein